MKNTIRTSPFMIDLFTTTVTSVLTIISFIIVTRILADGLGPEKFGAYSLVRRILSTIEPFSTLGMGVALSRYLAIGNDEEAQSGYFLSGFILVMLTCLMIVVIGLPFKNKLTQIIFHSSSYRSLYVSMLFLIVGYSFYIVLYSYYRGLGHMGRANLWQLGVMAVVPIIIVIIYARSAKVDQIVFLFGLCFFSAFIPLLFFAAKVIKHLRGVVFPRNQIRELLQYGLPRIPSQIAFWGMLMLGPFMAPYFGGIKDAGYLVVSQSLLRVVEGGIEGFSRVALPKVTKILAEGRQEFLTGRINDLIAFIIHFGLFTTMHLFIWTDHIVWVWLGNQYGEVIPIMKITVLAIVPFMAYSMLRSIIDAIEVKAVNAFNLYLSFSVALFITVVLAKAGLGSIGLAIGMTGGFWALGILTIRFLWKLYKIEIRSLSMKESVFLNLIFILLAFPMKYWLETHLSGTKLLGMAFLMEMVFLFLYCFILWKLSVRWTVELMERVFRV
jgi:O-antigen/teichoic acid export membrane protein